METLKMSDVMVKKSKGYKASLEIELPDFTMTCPIRFETMSSKDVKEQHKVIFKDEAGKKVIRKYIGESRKLTWVVEGKETEQAKGNILAFQNRNGQETPVEKFEKSETIKIVKTAPKEIKDRFLIERTTEIWSDEQGKLWRLAEYLLKNNSVALCSVVMTQGYDTQFLGIIEPRLENGTKFGFIMFLTKKQLVFNHLLDNNTKRVETAKPIGLEILNGVI